MCLKLTIYLSRGLQQGEKEAGRDSFAAQKDRSEGAGGVEGGLREAKMGVTYGHASSYVIYRKPEAQARDAASNGCAAAGAEFMDAVAQGTSMEDRSG